MLREKKYVLCGRWIRIEAFYLHTCDRKTGLIYPKLLISDSGIVADDFGKME